MANGWEIESWDWNLLKTPMLSYVHYVDINKGKKGSESESYWEGKSFSF